MKDTALYEQLLGLKSPWSVKRVDLSMADQRVTVEVVLKSGQVWGDPTNASARAHIHGWHEREWRHLDTCQFETVIKARVPQLKYSNGQVEELTVPWAKRYSRVTTLMESFVLALLQACPNTEKVSSLTGLSWHTVNAIMAKGVERGMARREAEAIAHLGLDEKSTERGHSYASILTDIARYERIREGGQIVDCAVLVAVGVTAAGHRRVLGVSVALSEAEVHWRQLLSELIRRGLRGVKLIVSDDHAGLKAARRATLPSVPWQRCQFHLQQNAHAYVPRLDLRKEVAGRIRSIFNAPDKAEAQRLLNQAVERWQQDAPKLAQWAETNLTEGFAVFDYPAGHRTRLRTTNGLERINRELKRRTRVASIFPNADSCLRLVSALLAECDEDWMTGKIYLTMKT